MKEKTGRTLRNTMNSGRRSACFLMSETQVKKINLQLHIKEFRRYRFQK